MRTKAPRIIIAAVTVALVSLGGLAAPVEAAQVKQATRTGWCC